MEYQVGDRLVNRHLGREVEIVEIEGRWFWLEDVGDREQRMARVRDDLEAHWRRLPRVVQERLF